jgi:hypothetical protein
MDILPIDVMKIIFEYINVKTLLWVSKKYYIKYHNVLTSNMLRKNYNEESYLRNIIKNDYYFVFQRNVEERIYKWISIKSPVYNNIVFKNYLHFLINYCIDKNATRCRNVLVDYMKQIGLYENIKNKKSYNNKIKK